MTFCAAVDDDGKFAVELTNLDAPLWNLTLGSLLVNGAESRERFTFQCNERGEPDPGFLASRIADDAEQMLLRDPAQTQKLLTDEAIATAPNEEARRRLRLLGDGKELYRSKLLRPGQKETLRLEIANIQQLELHADGGEGHNRSSWAIWADPVVEK